jgi:hypothetical protein
MTVERLPLPDQCRSPREALAAAGRIPLQRVVLIGESADELVVLSAGSADQMDAKTMLWLLRQAERLLLG